MPMFSPEWELIFLDQELSGETPIVGQFFAEDYTESRAATFATQGIPGRDLPLTQYVRGDEEIVTFTATFFDDRALVGPIFPDDTLRDVRRRIRSTTEIHPGVGRPPLFLFVWGDIEHTCFVESVGGARFDALWDDGRPKQITFEMSLRVVDLDQFDTLAFEVDPSAPVSESLHKPVVIGDSYELLAREHYGDPIFGVFLRQDNLLAFPQPGDIVRLPNVRKFVGRRLEPKTFALSDNTDVQAAIREAFDARADQPDLPFVLVD